MSYVELRMAKRSSPQSNLHKKESRDDVRSNDIRLGSSAHLDCLKTLFCLLAGICEQSPSSRLRRCPRRSTPAVRRPRAVACCRACAVVLLRNSDWWAFVGMTGGCPGGIVIKKWIAPRGRPPSRGGGDQSFFTHLQNKKKFRNWRRVREVDPPPLIPPGRPTTSR